MERYEEAIVAYEKAISLNPEHYLAINGKGNALRKLKRFDEARRCYLKTFDDAYKSSATLNN
jgi:protein O-GlcNAc transferase